jgi:ubiquinone/menaquinone biosynthesis C-methylase UbiE
VIVDKRGLLDGVVAGSRRHLELGCGPQKHHPDAIGVDSSDHPAVDVVATAEELLASLAAASVATISSYHFLEHVDDLGVLLAQAARVLEDGGTFRAVVPHFSSPYYYSDPTHRHFFGLYTLGYFVEETPLRRKVPTYGTPLPFIQQRVHLGFKSPRPFYGRYILKRAIGWLVNLNRYTQELYEENFSWWFPCYEVEHVLVRRRRTL